MECQSKQDEFKLREKSRHEELEAIDKAVDALRGDAFLKELRRVNTADKKEVVASDEVESGQPAPPPSD